MPEPPELDAVLEPLEAQARAEDHDHGDLVARARESLEETLLGLRLTPDEERAVAEELRQLRDLAQKLDQNTVEIAAFGMVSRGKSSVLNALVGQEVFRVGATHGTTVARAAQRWEQSTLGRPGLEGARLVVVDTPGIDEVGGEAREAMAREVTRIISVLSPLARAAGISPVSRP
jgi:predicted GTPase